jgi:hypothetical protein
VAWRGAVKTRPQPAPQSSCTSLNSPLCSSTACPSHLLSRTELPAATDQTSERERAHVPVPMRRRRWARAAALCLAIAAVLQLAVHGAGAAAGTPFSGRAARRWPPASPPMVAAHHGVPKPRHGGSGRPVAFDAAAAAAAAARCKPTPSTARKSAPGVGGAACADDDKRVVPTGPNPLHNR